MYPVDKCQARPCPGKLFALAVAAAAGAAGAAVASPHRKRISQTNNEIY